MVTKDLEEALGFLFFDQHLQKCTKEMKTHLDIL